MVKIPYAMWQIDKYLRSVKFNYTYNLQIKNPRYPDELIGERGRTKIIYSLQHITTARPKYRYAYVCLYKDEDFEDFSKSKSDE